jgi:hypothetical protein
VRPAEYITKITTTTPRKQQFNPFNYFILYFVLSAIDAMLLVEIIWINTMVMIMAPMDITII